MTAPAAAATACAAAALTVLGLAAGAPAAEVVPVAAAQVPSLAPREALGGTPALTPWDELSAARAVPRRSPALAPLPALARREARARRHAWRRAFRSARSYARARRGTVAVALVDDQGRQHGYAASRQFRSASLVKAMLLVAYLRRPEIRARALPAASRALLGPMITRSDNAAATQVRDIVGNPGLARLARAAGMHHFASAVSWGDTLLAAGDQARFFHVIDRLVPPRHRAYARRLLSGIVTGQRWGIPAAAPRGARVFFKGGWRPEDGGWRVLQSALVESGERRVSLSVLTEGDSSEAYGRETVLGTAARLLRVLEPR